MSYRVTKAGDVQRMLENAQGAFNNMLSPVAKELELSSSWARHAAINEDTVMSEEYGRYNGFMEVCRAHPHLLRKGPVAATLTWDSALLDKCDAALLITGPPGYGKTSFCKWSALNDRERFARSESNIMPIYIPLYRLADSMPKTFEEGLIPQERFPMVWSKPGVIREGLRIRLYLDGLDELSTTRQAQILSLVREACRRYHQSQVVVAARDQVVGPELKWLRRIHGRFERRSDS
jgi:hypothetical protein